MEYYYHEQLTNLEETGFGLISIDHPNTYAPPHWHQALELLFFLQGEVTCKFSHSTILAEPGDLLVINSQDIHETRCSRDAKYLVVHILPGAMCRYVDDFDQLYFSIKFDPDDMEKSAALDILKENMGIIHRLHQTPTRLSRLQIQARLFDAVALLVDYFSKKMTPEDHSRIHTARKRLEPLLEDTQARHAENLTLDSAAEFLGLNREYFCRLFKKNMGVSYLTYLNQVRAAAVCRELETSDDPIGLIGERHGFTNSKMLNQYFRELYGCTPSEKRKTFRNMVLDGVY